jgi:hypothetical protein
MIGGVILSCPGPTAPKLNGDPVLPPVDVEGVSRVNTNTEGLEPAVPFMVVEGNIGCSLQRQE